MTHRLPPPLTKGPPSPGGPFVVVEGECDSSRWGLGAQDGVSDKPAMPRLFAVALVAALLVAAPARADVPAKRTYGAHLGSHSMLYLNSTAAQQEALFRAAAEAGVRYLRMDFTMPAVFTLDGTDFSAVERIDALAEHYGLQLLGVITETPWFISGCEAGVPFELLGRCAPQPRHEARWRDMVAQVVARAPGVRFWELGNEPDDPRTFRGTPADYARWASLAAEGIRAARPGARIALGGFSRLDRAYIDAVLHDAANPLIGQIDIANVHVRGPLRSMRTAAGRARAFYRRMGFEGRLWITETGYPSLAQHQWDPRLRGGERDQARYLATAPRLLIDDGADAVFVAFRDSPEFGPQSPYASEGVVLWPQLAADGRAVPKPAFWALRALAARRLP
jgi:hypothetical protein